MRFLTRPLKPTARHATWTLRRRYFLPAGYLIKLSPRLSPQVGISPVQHYTATDIALELGVSAQKVGKTANVTVKTREKNKPRVDSYCWVFLFGLKRKSGDLTNHYKPNGISELWDSCVKRAGIRRRGPYQTHHTFTG